MVTASKPGRKELGMKGIICSVKKKDKASTSGLMARAMKVSG
jgi:hypothetical protein